MQDRKPMPLFRKVLVCAFCAKVSATVVLALFPQIDPMGGGLTAVTCFKDLCFKDFLFEPWSTFLNLVQVVVSLSLFKFWPRKLTWSSVLVIGFIAGTISLLELPSGLLESWEIAFEDQHIALLFILLWMIIAILPFLAAILVDLIWFRGLRWRVL
jgi:hypothetical protein